jgi:hypothetical protein
MLFLQFLRGWLKRKLIWWAFCCVVLLIGFAVFTIVALTTGASPGSVEDKATKYVNETLDGISPSPTEMLDREGWSLCSEETPFVKRGEYQRTVDIGPDDNEEPAQLINEVLASLQHNGYPVTTYASSTDSDSDTYGADMDSDWSITLGKVANQVFLTIDSGCVHVSSVPGN